MKTDNYLTLCLEQAAKSHLRYRHGCIIVRGGKVIGQGFNDHRSGFSGGALKNGRLPTRPLNVAALAELKKKRKLKQDLQDPLEDNPTFTPFENMGGGGSLANTPLSMHSEMMAIHSALSASSTMASSTVSSQKPYFKLSSDSKRKARLRRDAIKSYVEVVCKAALAQSAAEQRSGSASVQQWRFEGATSQPGQSCIRVCREQYGETPDEEQEVSSSLRQWQTEQGTRRQQQASTVCA
jgi:deoxycytidylate deaminase